MFSISLQYAVLAAVCATGAQGDGSPVVDGGFQLYFPSQGAAWAEKQVAPWVHHLHFPTSELLGSFNQWLLERALAADGLSFSLAIKGSRGATREVAKSGLLTTIHCGLSFGRLLLAFRPPCWPMWFRVALQVVPGELQNSLVQQNLTSLLGVLSWVQRPPNGTAGYCSLSYAGLYIGKANLRRSQPSSNGLANRRRPPLHVRRSSLLGLAGQDADYKAFAVAQQGRIAEERFRKQGRVLVAALNTKFAETIAAVQKPPEAAQGLGASQQQSPSQAQASTGAPWLPGAAESQPLNQTQLDQVCSLLSELLPKQPEQAPLTGRLKGKKKSPAADGSTGVKPLQKTFVASMFGGRVSVVKLVFDTFKAQVLAATRTPRFFIPRGWRRWQVARHGAAQQVDMFLASCGLRTAARAELEKVFGVGTLWSEKSSPAWYSATAAVGTMLSMWLLALQSGCVEGPLPPLPFSALPVSALAGLLAERELRALTFDWKT